MPTPPTQDRSAFEAAFRARLRDGAGRGATAERDAADFLQKVRDSDMRYAGEPLDVAFFPLALDTPSERFLAGTVERTLEILERATRRFLGHPTLAARAYGWSEERLRVCAHDPGYPLAIPCARFDSYWDGAEGLRFLEVNTDGTSGMTNVERVSRFFLEAPTLRGLTESPLTTYELRERVFESLLSCYAAWRERHGGRAPKEPRIVIVDWRTVKTSAEFKTFLRHFEERGLRAGFADPRELRFDGELLVDGAGERVDLVYRRVVSTELFAAPQADVTALLSAYLLDAVCVVGSFRSDVAFDKRIMALVTDPETAADELELTPDEIAHCARVFPWTRTLRPGPVLERAQADREALVLKPAGLYEGRGVRIGLETDPVVWRAAVEESAYAGGHIVQERVVPSPLTIEALEDSRFRSRTLHLSVGEYAFGGKFVGLNARVASTLVLSADDDERILPVVRLP